jgi:AcrR family transcriptional regulator
MRDEAGAAGWEAALHAAAEGAAAVTQQRRGTTLRDTRSIARRLVISAVTLFAQRGFDEVKVSEIAAHAGVTSRTFFRYFPAKETVIVDIYDRTNERLMELIETSVGRKVLPALEGAVVRWCEEYGELFAALIPMSDNSETLMAATLVRSVEWEQHLAEALGRRFPRLDPDDARVWAYTAMAMLRVLQQNASATGLSYADSARDAFQRLAALPGAPAARGARAAGRKAKTAG